MPMSAFNEEAIEEMDKYVRTVEENEEKLNRIRELVAKLAEELNKIGDRDLRLGTFASVITWLINRTDVDVFEAYGAIMYALFKHMIEVYAESARVYVAYVSQRRVMGS